MRTLTTSNGWPAREHRGRGQPGARGEEELERRGADAPTMSLVTPLAVPAAKPLRSMPCSLPLPLPPLLLLLLDSAPPAVGVWTRPAAGLVWAGATGWCGSVGYGSGSDVVEVAMAREAEVDLARRR